MVGDEVHAELITNQPGPHEKAAETREWHALGETGMLGMALQRLNKRRAGHRQNEGRCLTLLHMRLPVFHKHRGSEPRARVDGTANPASRVWG
jgi:hypothetical protein